MTRRASQARHARPAAPAARIEVPAELRPTDYGFPPVALPARRPLISPADLRHALEDDDTQQLDMSTVLEGGVVDDAPRPAHAEGLAPAAAQGIPVPANPFLNAGANAPAGGLVRIGGGLPARLAAELELWSRSPWPLPPLDPTPAPEPKPAPRPQPEPPADPAAVAPVRRSSRNPLLFASFDDAFWARVQAQIGPVHTPAAEMYAANDTALAALAQRLAALERTHQAWIESVAAGEYRGQLADAVRPLPLPRRIPGAALAAIEAGREGLVTA